MKRTLEEFDFGFQPSIDESQVRELAILVERAVGPSAGITEGAISIDGVRLDEPYLTGAHWSGSMRCVPHRRGCILGDDQYFVMGDNRGNSDDSRRWGPVSLADIVGRVWVTY